MKIITGIVISGAQNGERMGIKTANLAVSAADDLPKGLYVCSVEIDNIKYDGLLYYGRNSITRKDCLETHIINFSQDIYGKKIKIAVGRFLRLPLEFKNQDDLASQMKKDLQEANFMNP